ncbi:MAG TPA: glutathione S-transferase family protein [Candidatus Polarisedimenticolaceae bacterium]|nr:glutathione S-transferase family protein [Candidatus Polarisedimenticolaceae bacterium]
MAAGSDAQFPQETGERGEFIRQRSAFRQWVTADPGADHPAEPGRYHLYVSYACPWAHRTIIFRRLKRLERVVSMTVVDPVRDERGWAFTAGPGCGPDPINGFRFLAEAYRATDPTFHARPSVPVLWDKKTGRIVSNESSEIIRMFNREFDEWADRDVDFYPEAWRGEIDGINDVVYTHVNNGVYRCGFATTQAAYDEAFEALFTTLDDLERRLAHRRYLVGDRLTEADWRLFTTLIRFDPVYVGHFKCNLRRLVDYPALWAFTRELYQHEQIASTVDFDHIKRHYYVTHRRLNPSGIVPNGPRIDYDEPHGRDRLG